MRADRRTERFQASPSPDTDDGQMTQSAVRRTSRAVPMHAGPALAHHDRAGAAVQGRLWWCVSSTPTQQAGSWRFAWIRS